MTYLFFKKLSQIRGPDRRTDQRRHGGTHRRHNRPERSARPV